MGRRWGVFSGGRAAWLDSHAWPAISVWKMLVTLRSRVGLLAIALAAAVAAMFAPSALAFYRCNTMATTMSSPCCEQQGHSRGSSSPQLQSERCCSKVTVALERAPSEPSAKRSGQLLPRLPRVIAMPTAFALAAQAPAAYVAWWRTQARFDVGPPIVLRTCALLI
jgi:hypothetical protein